MRFMVDVEHSPPVFWEVSISEMDSTIPIKLKHADVLLAGRVVTRGKYNRFFWDNQ